LQDITLQLTQRLFDAGRGTVRDVDQAVVLAENARAQVPMFEAERRAALYALAMLTGRPPAELDAAAAGCVAVPSVATLIPVGDGSALLARRPDVRQAERRLAADTARIGVETAALYPSIRLLGSASLGAQSIGDLGKSSSISFSLGPLISWTFPNIGVARARVRQVEAGAAASLATFDGTVLTALKELEQALARYAGELDRNAALRRSEASAANAARIAGLRFEAGRDNLLQRIDAERDRAGARAARAQSDAALAEAQVSLFKALGGGWEQAPEPTRR
jgi:outer membrane protein TolC